MIVMALQHISPEVIVKGFKRCCISNAVYGTDDDMLWNGSEEVGNISRKIQELTVKLETLTLL